MRIEIHPTHPQARKVAQAVEVLRRGGVIVYPTGTVYGLGCDIHQKKAIERIYQIRQLKKDHPLSFMCPDLSKIARYAHVDDFAYRIMKRLVPGPYTFVLQATREVPKLLVRKQKTVGIRVPDDPVALALLNELGSPIVSTSATSSTERSSTTPTSSTRASHTSMPSSTRAGAESSPRRSSTSQAMKRSCPARGRRPSRRPLSQDANRDAARLGDEAAQRAYPLLVARRFAHLLDQALGGPVVAPEVLRHRRPVGEV